MSQLSGFIKVEHDKGISSSIKPVHWVILKSVLQAIFKHSFILNKFHRVNKPVIGSLSLVFSTCQRFRVFPLDSRRHSACRGFPRVGRLCDLEGWNPGLAVNSPSSDGLAPHCVWQVTERAQTAHPPTLEANTGSSEEFWGNLCTVSRLIELDAWCRQCDHCKGCTMLGFIVQSSGRNTAHPPTQTPSHPDTHSVTHSYSQKPSDRPAASWLLPRLCAAVADLPQAPSPLHH